MVKYTPTIRRQKPTHCLSVFDQFLGLALKGLSKSNPRHFGEIEPKYISDQKTFWRTMKSFFNANGNTESEITLENINSRRNERNI